MLFCLSSLLTSLLLSADMVHVFCKDSPHVFAPEHQRLAASLCCAEGSAVFHPSLFSGSSSMVSCRKRAARFFFLRLRSEAFSLGSSCMPWWCTWRACGIVWSECWGKTNTRRGWTNVVPRVSVGSPDIACHGQGTSKGGTRSSGIRSQCRCKALSCGIECSVRTYIH